MRKLCLFAGLSVTSALGCTNDDGCNLNGACEGGACRCLAAWRGATCGELALLPAARGAGLHAGASANASAWGGALAYDAPSGRWQMFAAEMVLGCGINAWETNSRIVRASSASLDAPFEVEEEVRPPFSHEPSLARDGASGAWLLYSIGNASSSNAPRPDCAGGYTSAGAPPNGTGGNFKHYVPVEIRSSPALTAAAGKWALRATIGNGDFNPSPLLLPNGSALLMWRHLARTHMVAAASWAGPYAFNGSDGACPLPTAAAAARGTAVADDDPEPDPGCEWWHLFNTTVDARGLEDPFMFVQPAATAGAPPTYHALFHDHESFGGHAFSSDGASWTFSGVPPYSNVLAYGDGGGSVALQRRERPHLAFDSRGFILALSTSAQPPPTAAKSPPAGFQNDYSFTSVQPVVPQPPPPPPPPPPHPPVSPPLNYA